MSGNTPYQPDQYNFFSNNNWQLAFPYADLDPNYSNTKGETAVMFNLFDCKVPSFKIATRQIGLGGVMVNVPLSTPDDNDKTMVFNYLMGENWRQYIALTNWKNKIAQTQIGTPFNQLKNSDGLYNTRGIYLDLPLFILSSFKKPIIKFTFREAFLTEIGEIDLQQQDPTHEMKHSFTVSYAWLDIEIMDNVDLSIKIQETPCDVNK